MLRPYEMDTDAVSIALIHAISTNTGQASGSSPNIGRGVKAVLKPFPLLGEGFGMGCVFIRIRCYSA